MQPSKSGASPEPKLNILHGASPEPKLNILHGAGPERKLNVFLSSLYLIILCIALTSPKANAQTIQLAFNVDSINSVFAGTYYSGAFHVSDIGNSFTLADGDKVDNVYLGTLSFNAQESSYQKTYESFYQNIDRTFHISINGAPYDDFSQTLPVGLTVGRDGFFGQYNVSYLQSMGWDTTFNLINGGTLDLIGIADYAYYDGLEGDTTIPLQASFIYHAPATVLTPELPTYINFFVGLLGIGCICLIKRLRNHEKI